MNSEYTRTSESSRLFLNLSDKTTLKRGDKYVALSTEHEKSCTLCIKYCQPYSINLKRQLQRGMNKLISLNDHILYQMFNIIPSISSKKHQPVTDNLPIRLYAK